MKLLAMILTLPVAALAVTVEPLPPSEYADTEVSTNIAFVVDRSMMTRIEFTVALDATPTNNVEVAIGTDGNGDGNLSVEEAAYVFGYDCGKWFVRDQAKSKVEVEERNLSTCASLTSGETPLPRCGGERCAMMCPAAGGLNLCLSAVDLSGGGVFPHEALSTRRKTLV